jgi:hypothetical protein
MKKIFVTVGLAAAGAAGWSSASAQSMEAGAEPKFWNVSASLRGFYDDNYAVAQNKKGSFGVEFTPSISANIALKQTDIGVKYTFGMYYYLQRASSGINPLDMTHQGDLWLDHAFNQKWKLNLTDSIAMAQDPQLIQGGSVIRVAGNNIANHAMATLNTEWTKQFSTAVRYGNNLYNYNNNGVTNAANPGVAGLLNRMEQNAGIDLQWHFSGETVGFVGYNYSWVRYSGNGHIAEDFNAAPSPFFYSYFSYNRNYNAHYGYVGVSHEFSPSLSGSARVGVSDTEVLHSYDEKFIVGPSIYYRPGPSSASLAPYVDTSLIYTYRPGSYLQGGFTHNINSTDVATPSTATHLLTEYQESSVFYANIHHRFNPKLTGSILGQYQYSTFKEGAYSGKGDTDLIAGCNLNYQLNRYLSAEVGYNFDDLISSIGGRANTRNRVYLGLSANY